MSLLRLMAAVATTVLAALPAQAQDKTITVFAAASMKNAVDDIGAAFQRNTGLRAVASLGASSALARQIEQGAPADVFASADLDWMDYLDRKSLIRKETRFNLLGNRLVLIAPADSKLSNVAIGQGFDLARLAGDGRIAMADVNAVPAGKYGKAALEKLGAWAAVEKKTASAENVRAALALVGRGEAPLGIVYETDARIDASVKIVGIFPDKTYPAIVYPVALTATAKPEAAMYLDALRAPQAKATFAKYGFTVLPAAPPSH